MRDPPPHSVGPDLPGLPGRAGTAGKISSFSGFFRSGQGIISKNLFAASQRMINSGHFCLGNDGVELRILRNPKIFSSTPGRLSETHRFTSPAGRPEKAARPARPGRPARPARPLRQFPTHLLDDECCWNCILGIPWFWVLMYLAPVDPRSCVRLLLIIGSCKCHIAQPGTNKRCAV